MTANRALRELQSAGVIVRRAGSGSFIAEPKPIGHMIEIRNIAEEIRGRGHDYRARVIQNFEEKASAETAALLEVPVGTKIFHSIIVHHEAEFPIQLEERSEEHTSELQSLMRISYAVFCLKKKTTTETH